MRDGRPGRPGPVRGERPPGRREPRLRASRRARRETRRVRARTAAQAHGLEHPQERRTGMGRRPHPFRHRERPRAPAGGVARPGAARDPPARRALLRALRRMGTRGRREGRPDRIGRGAARSLRPACHGAAPRPAQVGPRRLVSHRRTLRDARGREPARDQLRAAHRNLARPDRCARRDSRESPGPLVVAGDFNTWNAERVDALEAFARRLGLAEASLSFGEPARFLGRPVDTLFTRGIDVEDAWIEDVASSDHKPIVATIRISRP